MRKNTFVICLTYFVFSSSFAQTNLPYLGETPPSDVPKVFAHGVISQENRSEFGSIFSKDGTEFFFAIDNNKAEIKYSKWTKGSWTTPTTIIGHATYSYNDPMLSPDEQRLYYISDQPRAGQQNGNYDIWYSERRTDGWSEPINAGNAINSPKNEYYISFTADGTMYFSSNKHTTDDNNNDFDIYVSENVNGVFQEPAKLSSAINTTAYEADVFVAPDEAYIIFCSRRKEGLGRGDLYISHKQGNGEWSEAKSLKAPINTERHELCPWVTSDGKYFLYTSNQDIYWVSAKVLEE